MLAPYSGTVSGTSVGGLDPAASAVDIENGPNQGQNSALSGLCVPSSLSVLIDTYADITPPPAVAGDMADQVRSEPSTLNPET